MTVLDGKAAATLTPFEHEDLIRLDPWILF
jgi:hypothetical protein